MTKSIFTLTDDGYYLSCSELFKTKIGDTELLKILDDSVTKIKNHLGPSFFEALVDGTKVVSEAVAEISDISFNTAISMIDTVTGGLGSLVPALGGIMSQSLEGTCQYLADSAESLTKKIQGALEDIASLVKNTAEVGSNKKTILVAGGVVAGVGLLWLLPKIFKRDKVVKPIRGKNV